MKKLSADTYQIEFNITLKALVEGQLLTILTKTHKKGLLNFSEEELQRVFDGCFSKGSLIRTVQSMVAQGIWGDLPMLEMLPSPEYIEKMREDYKFLQISKRNGHWGWLFSNESNDFVIQVKL